MTEQAKREYAARSIAGGPADGASLLSAGAGSAPGAATATSSRSGLGGAASGAGEDEDETSALKGAEGGGRTSPGTPRTTTAWNPSARGRSFGCSTRA